MRIAVSHHWSFWLLFLLTYFLFGCNLFSERPCAKSQPDTGFSNVDSINPDNTSQGTIVFACSNGDNYHIMKMNSDGSSKVYLTRDSHWDQDPIWTMDGKYIFFTRGFDIFRMDADGSNVMQITEGFADASDPAPSPDGQRVAYVSQDSEYLYHIYVINVDGSGLKWLADGQDPAWSPDGQLIAYSVDGSIFVIEPDGGEPKKLVSLKDKRLFDPAWSWDGKRIAYTTMGPPGWITITDADGTNIIEMDPLPYIELKDPSWSPDGMWLSVMSSRGHRSGSTIFFTGFFISIIKTDGSGDVIYLTEELMDSESASWGP